MNSLTTALNGGQGSVARSSSFSSIVSTETLKEVENIYLAAARIAPQNGIDADIQV